MTDLNYNPFGKENEIKTSQGLIFLDLKNYITERDEEYIQETKHFKFKKTELEIIKRFKLEKAIIKIRKQGKQEIYTIEKDLLPSLKLLEQTEDEEILIPTYKFKKVK